MPNNNDGEITVVIPPPHPRYYLQGGDLHIIVSPFQLIVFHSDYFVRILRQRTPFSVSTVIFSPAIRLCSKRDSTLYLPASPRKEQRRILPSFWMGLQLRSSKLFFGYFTTRTFNIMFFSTQAANDFIHFILGSIPYMMRTSRLGKRFFTYRTNSSLKR